MQMTQMTRSEIVELLRSGLCSLRYTKTDGSCRDATGTLQGDIIPKEKKPKNTETAESTTGPEGIIRYYDVYSEGWRSFNMERLICINLVLPMSSMSSGI